MQYDLMVFIGRFQPAHHAHIKTIESAFDKTNNVVLLVGSADQPRTIENPWNWREREEMIRAAVTFPRSGCSLFVAPMRDFNSDQRWITEAQNCVDSLPPNIIGKVSKIGLIGHAKDARTARYLKMFPQWERVDMPNIDDLHASNIRESFFSGFDFDEEIGPSLPDPIHDYLKAFAHSEAYGQLVREYQYISVYKDSWLAAPYAPIFVTSDAVVVQSGHVLLIRRRAEPGKGLWAIPGGFVNPGERVLDAAIRELREETKIKCPEPVLRGSIKDKELFDAPGRSLRGRTITNAFYIELPPGELHPVKGSDDAEKAKWIPLSVVRKMEGQMFEDHFQIIEHFIGEV